MELGQLEGVLKVCVALCLLAADCILIAVVLTEPVIKQHPFRFLLVFLFSLECCELLVRICTDYASQIIQRPTVSCPISDAFAALQMFGWFGTLFLLPVLACLHLASVVWPTSWKSLSLAQVASASLLVALIGALLAFPHVYPSCTFFLSSAAFPSSPSNHTYIWVSKPEYAGEDSGRLLYIMKKPAIVILQLLPLLITIVMDAAIVLLIYRKRRFRQQASQSAGRSEEYTMKAQNLPARRNSVGACENRFEPPTKRFTVEMRLSLNFVLISLTRIYYAVVYMVALRNSGYHIQLLLVLSSFISYSKGLIYIAFSPRIRNWAARLLRISL